MKTSQIARGIVGALSLAGVMGAVGCGAVGPDGEYAENEIGESSQAIAIANLASSGYAAFAPLYVKTGANTVVQLGGASLSGGTAIVTVKEYNKSTDTWTAKTSLNVARKQAAISPIPGRAGKFLIAAGVNAAGARVNSLEIYDAVANTMVSVTGGTLSSVRSNLQAVPCGSADKVLIIAGDSTGGDTKTLEVFSFNSGTPASSTVATLKNAAGNTVELLGARQRHSAVALGTNNEDILVTGGELGSGTVLNTSERIHVGTNCEVPNADTVNSAANPAVSNHTTTMPFSRSRLALQASAPTFTPSGGSSTTFEALAFLGRDTTVTLPVTTAAYDVGTDTWALAGSLGAGRGRMEPAFAVDGTTLSTANIGTAGGSSKVQLTENSVKLFDTYDPATNAWTAGSDMTLSRYGNSLAFINGNFIAAQGETIVNGGTPTLTGLDKAE